MDVGDLLAKHFFDIGAWPWEHSIIFGLWPHVATELVGSFHEILSFEQFFELLLDLIKGF